MPYSTNEHFIKIDLHVFVARQRLIEKLQNIHTTTKNDEWREAKILLNLHKNNKFNLFSTREPKNHAFYRCANSVRPIYLMICLSQVFLSTENHLRLRENEKENSSKMLLAEFLMPYKKFVRGFLANLNFI